MGEQMKTMRRVTGWETPDGGFFRTKREADVHMANVQGEELLRKFVATELDGLCLDDPNDFETFMRKMKENAEHMLGIFQCLNASAKDAPAEGEEGAEGDGAPAETGEAGDPPFDPTVQ